MDKFELFLAGLMLVSSFSSTCTEVLKKIFAKCNVKYNSNIIVGAVSTVLSVALGSGYTLITGTPFTGQTIVYILAMIVLSWVCAMVGYDKVVEILKKLKGVDKNEQ